MGVLSPSLLATCIESEEIDCLKEIKMCKDIYCI